MNHYELIRFAKQENQVGDVEVDEQIEIGGKIYRRRFDTGCNRIVWDIVETGQPIRGRRLIRIAFFVIVVVTLVVVVGCLA